MISDRADVATAHCPCGGGCPKCAGAIADPGRAQTKDARQVMPGIVQDAIRAPGQPLDGETRAYMEPRFGSDLSQVRLHTDALAAASAGAVHAQAYTVGQDVVFADSQFAPSTREGRELLAHELAHTVQQSNQSGPPPQNAADSLHERTARTAARDIAQGGSLGPSLPSVGLGLSLSPDDEREKAVADALALLKQMEQEEAEESRNEAADEAKVEQRREALLRPGLSLVKPYPKLVSDEEIYNTPDQLREKAVAEAEAVLADLEQADLERQHADEEEKQEEQLEEQRRIEALQPRLHGLGPEFEDTLTSDEEIYESLREPQPDETAFWGKQEAEPLERPIQIAKETRFVRKWQEITIEGRGDQGDRREHIDVSYWQMSGTGLRGFIQYVAGALTPFEEKIVNGDFVFEEGFTPVGIGEDGLGYYTVSGQSGSRHHRIYNRDGSIYRSWETEVALVNMGIGPIALALPGIGLRSLARGGASLARGGASVGRSALAAGERVLLRPLKQAARKGVIKAKLAIGRMEAGAASAAPTALGGFASRNAVTLVEGRAGVASVSRAGAETVQAGEAVAVPSIASTTQAAGQSVTTGTAATQTAAATDVATAGATVLPAAQAILDAGAIPEAIDPEASGQITNRITQAEGDFGEVVGEYRVFGEKGLEGNAFVRDIYGLRRPAGPTTDVRPIVQMFTLMMDEARALGATELRIVGRAVTNQNVMRLRRFIERRGGRVNKIDERTTELILPL